jgi:hypothetical protein
MLCRFFEPPDSYESKHRWDPKATWTKEEENKIRRTLGKLRHYSSAVLIVLTADIVSSLHSTRPQGGLCRLCLLRRIATG